MGLLNRLWTGIVAAVAGVALAVFVQLAGQMMIGLSIEYMEKIVIFLGIAGFLVGFAVGNRKIGAHKDKTHKEQ